MELRIIGFAHRLQDFEIKGFRFSAAKERYRDLGFSYED
jgi:hypothetical protein